MAVTFYLIRHGETDWNHQRRIVGQGDPALNATGRRQAEVAAEWLAGLRLDIIYTSDLSRARETAEIIGSRQVDADVRSDRRLREKDAGTRTGWGYEEARLASPEYDEAMRRDPLHTRPEGGESVADQLARVVEALDELAVRHPGQAVGVVTHGGALRCALMHAMKLTMEQVYQLDFDNCSLTVIEWGERPRVVAVNSVPDAARYHQG